MSTASTLDEILISSDSHVMEDPDLWVDRLPQRFRADAPRFSSEPSPNAFAAHKPGGYDPAKRVEEMTVDGVSAEVLYPTKGLGLFHLDDGPLQEACFQVYNDWLIDYCRVAGERLIGVALISAYDIGHAVQELERCARAGLRGALVWQVPPKEIPFMSDHYEPFWAAAQDLEMPVSLHILTGHDYSKTPTAQKGIEVYRSRVNEKIWGAMNSLFEIIFTGVLERFPRLKVVMAENDIGWMPFLVEQWDKYYIRHSPRHPISLTKPPSEYFREQVFATFLDDEVGTHLLDTWGIDNFMWSNDYPHPNGTWPNSRAIIDRDLGHLTAEVRAKIVRENVARLYNVAVPQPAA